MREYTEAARRAPVDGEPSRAHDLTTLLQRGPLITTLLGGKLAQGVYSEITFE